MERQQLLESAREFFAEKLKAQKFVPGVTYIPPTGKVLDENDGLNLIDASLDMWLTAGRYADEFEIALAKRFGRKLSKLTVSGSAANLLALSTLCSWKLGDKRLKPGDEIITVAAGFPTTVAPIIQNGCTPVFVDIEVATHNVDVKLLENAVNEKTKAIIIAHSLGNPFNLEAVERICKENDLFLIEDCCDAFGATYGGRPVGTFGELATLSFYPAHHITMGEGGAVLMDQMRLARICESFRDWGRDCYCKPGKDNTCGKRFNWQLGNLPSGYDHKYTYSHLGYNLKVSDMQAAVGLSQLSKLNSFIEQRRQNFDGLTRRISQAGLDDYYILPEATPNSEPSWFGFLLTLRDDNPEYRRQIISKLEDKKVGSRLLFGGNLTKQPAFMGQNFKIVGDLKNTDFVMNNSFWIGIWPGINDQMLDYMVNCLVEVTKEVFK
jgi:CDP-4-dehydro-6-deoxyglucose reductase, E1